jgi:hypothetical protein
VDPLFGPLAYDGKTAWHGRVRLPPESREVSVAIVTGDSEPGEDERSAFLELAQRYEAMRPAIGVALFKLYMPFRGGEPDGLPNPVSPEDMLSLTQLDWLEVGPSGHVRLGYGFRQGAGWDDAILTINIVDWTPAGGNLSD